ncbi:alcohol dehydrogenase catalytic domain-containing protein [Microbacterium sp. Se63.02b]|uniref:alcohol dehydrogenase catalytic domain-containing protein n=1 Tax=Microbacterium sp. Se63.02b TaxID=2709304 RepID=UPI001FCF1BD0|nr:alcohol dehydrogenase catalytic domain-containing protein [Microbacterium sp. Se63.02b]
MSVPTTDLPRIADLPRTTRAAVLTAHGEPLTLQDLPLPSEIEPGAALVRIACTTLCGTDIEIWEGRMTFPGMLPMVLGHEMVGEIVATGPDTRDALGRPLAPGDRIGWSESTCGECHGCVVLREPVACTRRGYGFLQRADVPPFATAGLSEYAYVTPGAAKLLLPASVKDTWASMAGCAAKTVLRAFERAGRLRTGSSVVVQGAGALGIFATAVAKISGAGQVITVGAPASRLALAGRFGADAVVDFRDGPVVDQVMALTGGRGADHVFDFAGAPGVGPDAIDGGTARDHRDRGLHGPRRRRLPPQHHHGEGAHRGRLAQRRHLGLLPRDRLLHRLRRPLPVGRALQHPGRPRRRLDEDRPHAPPR